MKQYMTQSILRVITDKSSGKGKFKICMADKDRFFSFHDSNSNVPTNVIAIWERRSTTEHYKKQCKEVELNSFIYNRNCT